MKYTKEQRLDIGRRIYNGEITRYQAAEEYDINDQTARAYMRMYRDINQLPPKRKSNSDTHMSVIKAPVSSEPQNLETYENMTREELIQELIRARITEARLKKGYEVKGDGSVIQYSSKSTR